MDLFANIKNSLKTAVMNRLSNVEVAMEARKRFGKASNGIVPYFTPQRRVSLEEWQNAVDLATNPHSLNRYQYYKVCDNAMLDLHLCSIVETRVLELQAAKFKMIAPDGKEDPGAIEIFERQWYLDYIKHAWESGLYGYSLIELFDLAEERTEVKLNRGKVAFNPFKEAILINRAHVRPEKGKWLVNITDDLSAGFDYTLPPYSHYYIGIGDKESLGRLKKLAPVALAKRYAVAAWGDYDEKLGIPFRKVTMQGNDAKREKLLAEIMQNMGPAGWGIFHEGETVELLQNTGSDVHKCFMELANFCDKQMSKSEIGSTMTVDAEGGQYKGEVHERTSEIRHEADKTFLEYLNNEQLVPRMIKRGYPLEGYKMKRDNTEELSVKDQIAIDTVLLQHYTIDPKYIADKYDIPVEMIAGKSPDNVADVITETQKKKIQPKNSSFIIGGFEGAIINSCEKLYFSCKGHTHVANKTFTFKDIEDVINKVFNQELKKGDIHEGLYDWQVKQFLKGLQEGFGSDFVSIKYNEQDSDLINNLKENVYIFSAFKNYQELRAMTDMLLDEDGNLKTLKQFKKDVLAVHETYDQRFLEAEYGHAVVSAQMAGYWEQIQREKASLPLLRYNSIVDGNTTNLCLDIDGVTLPVDDEFWNKYYPPNHWGCRGTVDQLAAGELTDLGSRSLPELKPMFENNVGKNGVVFPDNHPYYQASKSQQNKLRNFARKKFKPEDDE